MTRPLKSKEIKNQEKIMTAYLKGWSIRFAANKLGFAPDTIFQHYKKISNVIETSDTQRFLDTQEIVRSRILIQYDTMLELLFKKLKKIQKLLKANSEFNETDEIILMKLESLELDIIQVIVNMQERKSAAETAPTLKTKIDSIFEDKVRELDEREQAILKKEGGVRQLVQQPAKTSPTELGLDIHQK